MAARKEPRRYAADSTYSSRSSVGLLGSDLLRRNARMWRKIHQSLSMKYTPSLSLGVLHCLLQIAASSENRSLHSTLAVVSNI